MNYEIIAKAVVNSAFDVHKALGPGLLESTYLFCLAAELRLRGHRVETQKELPVFYKDERIECGYRLDLLVDDVFIVELKAIEQLHYLHLAQVLTYLKIAERPLGMLINFNVTFIKEGIKRVVNNYKEAEE